VKTKKVV